MLIDPNVSMIKNSRFYMRDELLNILYSNSTPCVSFKGVDRYMGNKYVDLALRGNYANYRVINLADIYKLGIMKSFAGEGKKFVNRNGEFLCIFNTLEDMPVGVVLRSLKQKEFSDISINSVPYGLDLIRQDFKFGDWLLVTEGAFDADSFRFLHKDSLAVLTSTVTTTQADMLVSLTDKFIIAMDSDKAGGSGFQNSYNKIINRNPNAKILLMLMYPGDKDLGIISEVYGDKEALRLRIEYYQQFLNSLKNIVI